MHTSIEQGKSEQLDSESQFNVMQSYFSLNAVYFLPMSDLCACHSTINFVMHFTVPQEKIKGAQFAVLKQQKYYLY